MNVLMQMMTVHVKFVILVIIRLKETAKKYKINTNLMNKLTLY